MLPVAFFRAPTALFVLGFEPYCAFGIKASSVNLEPFLAHTDQDVELGTNHVARGRSPLGIGRRFPFSISLWKRPLTPYAPSKAHINALCTGTVFAPLA